MLTNTPDAHTVRRLLENIELKIVLDSPGNDYRFEYFTTFLKDRQTAEPRLTRTYQLLDLIRGGVTPEPWDAFDLDKQTTLVTNLMRVSHYRMTKIVCGWKIICPVCGHDMRGKIWESIPKICKAKNQKKCKTKIDDERIDEILLTAQAT